MIDSTTLFFLSGRFIIGILIFIRITGMYVTGPFFSSQAIVPQLKIFIAVILAISITTVYWQEQPPIDLHPWYLVFLVFKEFFVGAAIGFAANLVFWSARFAGGMIDFDMGYQTGLLFNPEETSPTLVGEFLEMIVLMIFLLLNGHHYLIESVYTSVKIVPLSTFSITQSTIREFIQIVTSVMVLGLKMAAPVLIALFFTNLALSLLARVAPQTNIFILSLQAKIAIGLALLLVTTPLFVFLIKNPLQEMETGLMRFVMSLNQINV